MSSKKDTSIEIKPMDKRSITVRVMGTSPIIHNAMSQKVRQELLMPRGRLTASEKKGRLKHNVYEEFANSPYVNNEDSGETYIQILSAAVKGAMKSAALDLPGATKAQISRLTWVEDERIDVYGIPELMMAVTRSADINKTPDIRTRAIISEWACQFTVSFVCPVLNETAVMNLIAAAGIMQGLGDWRIGKGAGSYGGFKIVNPDDKDWARIVKSGGRKAQIIAMENPVCYDDETKKLMDWYGPEARRRGFEEVAA